jgi:hypothetical protein
MNYYVNYKEPVEEIFTFDATYTSLDIGVYENTVYLEIADRFGYRLSYTPNVGELEELIKVLQFLKDKTTLEHFRQG